MGKWTAGYHDDVLGAKMKSLVAGALKRSKIEKVEPTISYEAFVQDLDGGDWFTTSLIEVLVKELAERRTRQTPADDRRIADRTAKSLRLLALPVHIYRDRSLSRGLGRRPILTDYLTSPPHEMDMEEEEGDEGYEGMAESGENVPSFFEGARVNSDLYDAYNVHGWSAHPILSSRDSRRSHANISATLAPSSDAEANNLPSSAPLFFEPRTRSSAWTLPGSSSLMSGSAPTLTRQPSIRRTVRSRTVVDFNDFSTRRRSTFRNTVAEPDDPRSSEEVSSSLNPWVSGPISDEPLGSPGARRFFPFSRRRQVAITPVPPWLDNGASSSRPVSPPEPIAFRPLRSNSGPPPLNFSNSFADGERSPDDEFERPQLPRLRRGGLRAPESMLSRHASPVTGETDGTPPTVISILQEVPSVTVPTAEMTETTALTTTPEVAEPRLTLSNTGP